MSSGGEARKGFRALVASFLLGVLGLAGAVVAFIVPQRAVAFTLAIAACFAFAAFCTSLLSFGRGRAGPSIAALVASLLILAGVMIAFGSVSVMGFVEAVERSQPTTQHHVDEDYQFRLTAPTYETAVYDARVVRSINERAVAGMWIPEEELTVLVFVEQLYGRTLEAAAPEEHRLAVGFGEELHAGEPTRVRYAEMDAIRIQRGFMRGEDAVWTESTFFVHEGLVYHVHAESDLGERPSGDPWFPTALDAFTLLDGEVRTRFTPGIVSRDDGPDWRVRDNVYENGAWGVRVRGEDLELAYGVDAEAERDANTIAILRRRHPDVELEVRGHRIDGLTGDALEIVRESGADDSGDGPPRLEVSGQTLPFGTHTDASDRTWHVRSASWSGDGRAIELMARAPTLELLDAHLPEMLSRVEVLRGAERDALRRDIDRAGGEWRDVGDDWWIRGGAFVDQPSGTQWVRPNDRWRVRLATEDSPSIVHIEAPSLGLSGEIYEYPMAADGEFSPLAAHRAHIGAEGVNAQSEPEAREISDGAGGSLHALFEPLLGQEVVLASQAGRETMLVLEIRGTRSDLERHASEARAAIDGFSTFLHAGESDEPIDRNPRMGYAFRRPWPEPAARFWDTIDEDVGSFAEYSRGFENVGLFAARRDRTMTPEAQRDVLLARFYDGMLREQGTWRDRTARLGGRPCTLRQRTMPFGLGGASVYALDEGGILYVLVVQYRNGIQPSRVARGFTLLR